MRIVGDFHIHSHYSIATSKKLVPEHLDYWARVKGITVVGTGDFTHPGWTAELTDKLEPAEPGLFRLRDEFRLDETKILGAMNADPVRFVLTAEISNIYKREERVRKIHNVVLAPDFDTVARIQQELGRIGNITSDGRPILGLDSRDLLEICLEASAEIFFIPAHIWTPWFSALGSKSGFDTIEECYRDLTPHITAVETGLSSDPPMNWACSFLDRYTLVSNSDAHSPEKLGREANLLDTELSYRGIVDAMSGVAPQRFLGTIEFFPEEGKYHYDGHRKCGVCWDPLQTLRQGGVCPQCGKPVTVGVLNRVAQLADRKTVDSEGRRSFRSTIPLKEILAQIAGVGSGTKRVSREYNRLILAGFSELGLLMEVPIDEIATCGGSAVANAIERMRAREVRIQEGYDGEYGTVQAFFPSESEAGPTGLFEESTADRVDDMPGAPRPRPLVSFDLSGFQRLRNPSSDNETAITDRRAGDQLLLFASSPSEQTDLLVGLNAEQRAAASHQAGAMLILAGPGTGKTRTLAHRIALLISQGVDPGSVLALTFSNKAAEELRGRLEALLGNVARQQVNTTTFHSFGLSVVREQVGKKDDLEILSVIDEQDQAELARILGWSSELSHDVARAKRELRRPEDLDGALQTAFQDYRAFATRDRFVDFDDLLYETHRLLTERPDLLDHYRRRYRWILIDEYQDIDHAQHEIIRLLCPSSRSNICVVGDPNQAIYGFRGADAERMGRFTEDYPEAEVYQLKTSYRCSQRILEASGQVIGQGALEGREGGLRINIVENPTDLSEAEMVARTIERMMGGLRFFSMDSDITQGNAEEGAAGLGDFAVLCRIGRQMPALEKAFGDHAIPYQRIGEVSPFRREPLRTIVDALRLTVRPSDQFAASRLGTRLKQRNLTTDDILHLPAADAGATIHRLADLLVDQQDHPDLSLLASLASTCDGDLAMILDAVALGVPVDLHRRQEAVSLMTLHSAKGLEFGCVFIVGCEDGILPYHLLADRESDPQEESRLFYVGMTRARHTLFLTHASSRNLYGKHHRLSRSPFLDRIEEALVQRQRPAPATNKRRDLQLGLF